jgi:DNA polymerase-3 subunit gamma/tau
MDFQVSARKWRPQKFTELIGQEHIVRTLSNAIKLDRISHSYLFSGTRGVGKTTTARILAKALNCEQGPTAEPCDRCSFCEEIRQGSSIDVREIDGASNNGVAEVRDLIENVQYATSSCKYKVYIIDEVHMLSKSAFNALLKTLEEPPPRVVFIFATTELNKIPETILSRCQCFEFKPLTHKQIIKQLELISEQEGIVVNSLGLEEIAKNGTGSMRDAQSLLDQVVAFSGKEVTPASVEAVLGIVGQKALKNFFDQVIDKNFQALLAQIQDVINNGKDLNYFCRDLAEYVRNLLIVKASRKPETLLDAESWDLKTLGEQAAALTSDEMHQMFNVFSRAEMEMKRSSLPQAVFEMAVLRLTDVRSFQSVDELIQKINEMKPSEVVKEKSRPISTQSIAVATNEVGSNTPVTEQVGDRVHSANWEKIKEEICRKKPVFLHYFDNSVILEFDDAVLHLGFPDPYTLDLVGKTENLVMIAEVVKAVSLLDVQVKCSLSQASDNKPSGGEEEKIAEKKNDQNGDELMSKSESEIIQHALDVFGGVLIR